MKIDEKYIGLKGDEMGGKLMNRHFPEENLVRQEIGFLHKHLLFHHAF